MEITAPIVSVQWLLNNLNNPNLVILDASTKENKSNLTPKYEGIQIKGARFFDMETTFVDKESSIPNMIPSPTIFEQECKKLGVNKNSVIVVYDNIGIYTSPRAWWMFKTMGHHNVVVLDGGLTAWRNENYPCEPIQQKTYKAGSFEAVYKSSLVKNAEEIVENINKKEFTVIDARSNDRFLGSTSEPRENMASGHIPNSINLPWKQVLTSEKMKSKNELEAVFKSLNIINKPLVFTCGSGVTACIILLASEIILKNNKALYDGSWSEWGQQGKYPIA